MIKQEDKDLLIEKLGLRINGYSEYDVRDGSVGTYIDYIRYTEYIIACLSEKDYVNITARALLYGIKESLEIFNCEVDDITIMKVMRTRIPSGKLNLSDLEHICKRTVDICIDGIRGVK